MRRGWRRTKEYREWRQKVMAKDGGKCWMCGGEATQAHHLAAASLNPDWRLDQNNGRAICKRCHRLTHNYGSRVNRWRGKG